MIQTIRDAACDCQDEIIRYNLNLIAAELEDALAKLAKRPTDEALQEVVGHRAHAHQMMDIAKRKGRGYARR